MFAQDDDASQNVSPFEALFIRQLDMEQVLYQDETTDIVDGHDILPQTKVDTSHIVFQYLDDVSHNSETKINDNFKDLQWLNVSRNLSLSEDLNDCIILCDFFTYCCVNCLHILPFLKQIEEKYSKDIVILGVHSPKFDNEKSLQNVSNAILRYDIDHPVCNDTDLKLWTQLCINCWPTIAIVGPNSQLLFLLVGEKSIQQRLQLYLDLCLQYFKNKLQFDKSLLPISLLKNSFESDLLYYPTKVAISPLNSKISISNTLKHSIIITDGNGIVEYIIGSNKISESGFKDGSFGDCLFNCPQGVVWQNEDVLFICDTENHAIRRIDLQTKSVQTVAGNGSLGSDLIGGKIGSEQTLNSPWDLTFDADKERLYIAMAGCHQIWVVILSKSGDSVNGAEYSYGTCVCFAGDGQEQKRNNRFPLKSSFAQPSGIAFKKERLFIADSESSSIRHIDTSSGCVTSLVGGNVNPLDLFAFGDCDGVGMGNVRLQHCMGVCVDESNDSIYIADTFNHKIKQVFYPTKKCETVEIKWNNADNKMTMNCLNEPNGLCFYSDKSQKRLLVCDTNNHRLLWLDLHDGKVSIFNIYQLSDKLGEVNLSEGSNHHEPHLVQETEDISKGQILQIELHFSLNNHFKVTSGAKQRIKIFSKESTSNLIIIPSEISTFILTGVNFEIESKSDCDLMESIFIQCDLNLCNDESNYCQLSRILIEQPVNYHANLQCEAINRRTYKQINVNL